jgi:hypothetical protein
VQLDAKERLGRAEQPSLGGVGCTREHREPAGAPGVDVDGQEGLGRLAVGRGEEGLRPGRGRAAGYSRGIFAMSTYYATYDTYTCDKICAGRLGRAGPGA